MKPLLQVTDASLDQNKIAIKVERDQAGRVHFRDSPLQSAAAARFSRLQHFVLQRDLVASTPESQIALCLIMFDGVVTRDDLERALGQIQSAYVWNSHYHLDWADPIGRTIRRVPSVFTLAALAVPRSSCPSVSEILSSLDDLLSISVRGPRKTYGLDLLLLDGQAWLTENVQDPLVAHCIGAIPMTSVPRSALARESCGLALPLSAGNSRRKTEGLASALAPFLNPEGADRGSWMVEEIVTTCRRNKAMSSERDKQRMFEACLALSLRASQAGPIAGLILAWVIDLLESGTRTKPRVKAITPAMYVTSAAMKLFEAFKGKNVESLGLGAFLKIYENMLKGLSPSKGRTLASALSSWHFFLTCWTNVEPLYKHLHKLVPISPPKANVLWPHELSICREWLTHADGDERFQGQLNLAFETLCAARIRASELLTLRIRNLRVEGDGLKIEVATTAADGGTKTPAGRRSQIVTEKVLIGLAKDWIARRVKEGAFPDDYVFGDPYRPGTQYQAGRLYVTLNLLIKAVTGDRTLATHVFSHTRISFEWAESIGQPQLADLNPVERLAVRSGHASATTGFGTYYHFPELWLRKELDLAIEKHLQTWQSIKSHVTLSHEAFRQARSRLKGRNPAATPGMIALEFIRRCAPELVVPEASALWAMVKPENPAWARELGPLDLKGALDLLHDAWYGHSPSAVALRSGRTESQVQQYAELALQILQEIGEVSIRYRADAEMSALSSLGSVLANSVGKRIEFRRAGQDKAVHLFDYLTTHLGGATDSGDTSTDLSRDGIESWASCYRRGYLSLENPKRLKGFIQLLDAAGFPRHLIIPRGIKEIDATLDSMIENTFRGEDSVVPAGSLIKRRYGRPIAYLTLVSKKPTTCKDGSLPSAAFGMSGIHAVMFGAALARAGIARFGDASMENKTDKGGCNND